MDLRRYRRSLLELEARLTRRTARLRADAVTQVLDVANDAGDASVADLGESEAFSEAEFDARTLQQVRDALKRIDDGTFGQCVVDGGPIEESRLDALPWTPFCSTHAKRLETAVDRRMPTL